MWKAHASRDFKIHMLQGQAAQEKGLDHERSLEHGRCAVILQRLLASEGN